MGAVRGDAPSAGLLGSPQTLEKPCSPAVPPRRTAPGHAEFQTTAHRNKEVKRTSRVSPEQRRPRRPSRRVWPPRHMGSRS